MIFDRTQSDIDDAILLRKEKVQKLLSLSEEEVQILEKGFLTINTLNRIEDKQGELKNLLNNLGYYNIEVNNTSWNFADYFKQTDFDRILSNLKLLVDSFFVYKDTPKIPGGNYRKYQVINDVEKILYDLEAMVNDIKNNYRQCGTFQCGE